MSNIRHFKVFSAILPVVLIATMVASCQPLVEEPQSESEAKALTEPEALAAEKDSLPTATEPEPDVESATETEPTSTTNNTLQLTPIDKLGITGVPQDVDIAEYRLVVSGLVEKPLSLTYEEILAYSSITEIGVINCPGFFVDIAEWTGVPLATILEEAGIKAKAIQVIFIALDGYRQKLTLEHVDEFGIFLAYIVNGETLPREHGYPLRVVDKGSDGSAWVKWLAEIRVE